MQPLQFDNGYIKAIIQFTEYEITCSGNDWQRPIICANVDPVLYFHMVLLGHNMLANSCRDKLAVISQTTYFQIYLFKSKLLYLDSTFTRVCSQEFHQQQDCISSDNDLVANRWQTNIWTKDDPIYSHMYASFGFDELTWCASSIDEVETWYQLSLNLALFPSRTSRISFRYNYYDISLYSSN